jgi:tetratricopeptide (TPR) repeat protein
MSAMNVAQVLELANRHFRSGRIGEAEQLSRQILRNEPQHAGALYLLGLVASKAGHPADAARLIQAAINQNPDSVDFRVDLGAVLLGLSRHAEAIECGRAALAIDPASVNALHLLGDALLMSGRPEEAIESFHRALAITPNVVEILVNLGCALKDLQRFDEATATLQYVLSIAPQCAAAHNNLGATFSLCGRAEQAIIHHRKALVIESDNPLTHWNYAFALLVCGEFKEGWEEFEWRLRAAALNLNRGFARPQWDGSDLAGRTILLHVEGGFGDGIQFARYVPMVAERGGRVVLECQPELVRLLEQMPGCDSIVARGGALPSFDVQCPLPSLPRIFQTTLETIPASVPYLKAGEKEAEFWKKRLGQSPGAKVGLVWSGSGGSGRWRSGAGGLFAPLAEVGGVQFYSLQKIPAGIAPSPPGVAVIDFTDELSDFADTAGFVANLDLVISVDTSIAHLAGAMGKPAWTLIPYASDFRWLRNREDSPWYPTMRLLRQTEDRNWNRVAERIAGELRSRFGPARDVG